MKDYEEQSTHQFNDFGLPEKRGPNPQRKAILEYNSRIRIEQPQRKLPNMLCALNIPLMDWAILKVRFPELESPDHEIQRKAWVVFHNHPISKPYRVTPTGYKL